MRQRTLSCAWVLVALAAPLSAETGPRDVAAAVMERDALFWKAYNACDAKAAGDFFTEDIEFYHDRGGITLGRANLVASIRDNLCGNPDSHVRREAVAGTVRVFPLQKQGVTYGAVESGEHLFYLLDKGQPERLDGHARFAHLWLLEDGAWTMSRILSYNHGPAEPR